MLGGIQATSSVGRGMFGCSPVAANLLIRRVFSSSADVFMTAWYGALPWCNLAKSFSCFYDAPLQSMGLVTACQPCSLQPAPAIASYQLAMVPH